MANSKKRHKKSNGQSQANSLISLKATSSNFPLKKFQSEEICIEKCNIQDICQNFKFKSVSNNVIIQQKLKRKPKCDINSRLITMPNWLLRCILALINIVIYANCLFNAFVYDDLRAILENRNVVGQKAMTITLLTDDFWGTPIHLEGSHKSYRPLVTLSYKLQWLINEFYREFSLEADNSLTNQWSFIGFQFHLVNVILHMLIVDQIYTLFTSEHMIRMLKFNANNDQKNQNIYQKMVSRWTSQIMIASLLFASHPIHVEAVASLVGRAELMGSLFALMSFKCLLGYLHQVNSQTNSLLTSASNNKSNLLSKSLFYLAMTFVCKENCAFSVIMLNLILVFVYPIPITAVATTTTTTIRKHQHEAQVHRLQCDTKTHENNNFSTQRRVLIGKIVLTSIVMFAARIAITLLSYQIATATTNDNNNWTLKPKFSHLDNPLIQSEHQFCLRNKQFINDTNNGDTTTSKINAFCSQEITLNKLRHSMWLTRLYLPFESLRQIAFPIKLSYDWPLNSLGGLIETTSDARFLLALSCYIIIITIFVVQLSSRWNLLRLHARYLMLINGVDGSKIEQKRDCLHEDILDCKKERGKNILHISQAEDSSDSCSETSSIKSVKTSDSGFVDNQSSTSTSRTNSPEPANNCNNLAIGNCSKLNRIEQIDWSTSICSQNQLLTISNWSLIWLLVPLIPSINLLWNVGFLLAERVLYLPSLGFCLLAAKLLIELNCLFNVNDEKKTNKNYGNESECCQFDRRLLSLFLPLLLLTSCKTMLRNADWTSELTLYESNLNESPAKSLSNLGSITKLTNFGELNGIDKQYDKQVSLFREALKLEPHSADLHYNL